MSVEEIREIDIENAAELDDVDQAAKLLQDIAGITSGDVASLHLDEKKWLEANHPDRVGLIRKWLKAEALYEE